MSERILIDTGPLVAFLGDGEPRHEWAVEQFKLLPAPFLTCEPVLTEAFFLLRGFEPGVQRFFDLLSERSLDVDFAIMSEVPNLAAAMQKYRDLPMSLADACLVRMAEQRRGAAVLTLDRHFSIYRVHGRQPIPTIMP